MSTLHSLRHTKLECSPLAGGDLNCHEFDFGYNLTAKTTLILGLSSMIQINMHLKIHDGTSH